MNIPDGRPDLRKFQRILLPEGRAIQCHGTEPKFEAVISVIGLGGMFIRYPHIGPLGTRLRVRVEDTVVTFRAECTVRDVADTGVGVEFTKLASEDERKLKDLLHRLRP